MGKTFSCIIILLASSLCFAHKATAGIFRSDIVIAGGGTSGVTAAVQAARLGASVMVVEQTTWLGGMLTAAGVGAVDGNYNMPAGLWGEFRDSLAAHYGSLEALKTGWVSNVMFEPSVGNRIFHNMVAKEKGVTLWTGSEVKAVSHNGNMWAVHVARPDGQTDTVEAKVLVDATELGDIAKMCGVPYDVGMESQAVTHEDIAPAQANNIVQDLTYVAILKDYGRDMTMEKPEGYNANDFACCCINDKCITPKEPNRQWPKDKMVTYGKMPGGKYMINWPIEGNDFYANMVDMTPEQRNEAVRKAKAHTMRFVYFMLHELGFNTLALADDEYPTADRLPFMPYHRESRRIHGKVRFTLNHMTDPYEQAQPLYRTNIAVGDYPVDHHHTRYTGEEQLPDLHFHPVPSFGLPLGSLLPQEVKQLVVAEKSVSVSNIANGSTRLQPVVMQIGQAAGALAAIAVKQNKGVDEVSVREVQNVLLEAGGYLMPYADVPKDSICFKPCQRIGATGILKGKGVSIDWHNKTLFRPDAVVAWNDIAGLAEVYPFAAKLLRHGEEASSVDTNGQSVDALSVGEALSVDALSVGDALSLVSAIAKQEKLMKRSAAMKVMASLAKEYDFCIDDRQRKIKRGELAVLIDGVLHPFEKKQVDVEGRFVR